MTLDPSEGVNEMLSAVHKGFAEVGTQSCVGSYVLIGYDGPERSVAIGPRATIRSHTVIYRDVYIGSDFSTGHFVLIRNGTNIGNDVSLGTGTAIEHSVSIGNHVRMHSGCFVPEYSVVKDGAWLGPGVHLTNAKYPNRPDTKSQLEGVTVGEGATLGANAVILPGIVVGEGSVVGAGSVVTADVTPGTTVIGNPARASIY